MLQCGGGTLGQRRVPGSNHLANREPMPSVTLHLVLADRVLERWQDHPSRAPFPIHQPVVLNAFYQGAFGPDLGYFPGGYRLLSDLSHLVKSGDLTRALVRNAGNPLERAFAWGWVTHVLGDQAIHPLVGQGVGEFLFGDRRLFVDGARNQAAHVQVETGLDAFYSHLFPRLRHRTMAPVFHGSSIRFLADAYQETYRLAMDPTLLLSSHLAVARMSVQALVSIGVMSTAFLAGPVTPFFLGARRVLRQALSLVQTGVGGESLLMAYLNPVPPAQWLVEKVGEVVETFADRFWRHYETGLEDLENVNLDTGQPEESPARHPGTVRTLRVLSRWRGGRLPAQGDGGLPGGTGRRPPVFPATAHG